VSRLSRLVRRLFRKKKSSSVFSPGFSRFKGFVIRKRGEQG
jgi:hypothetical protein